jgi:histidine triad (HIT) family protein
LNEILLAVPKISKLLGLDNGYKLITNFGKNGGQEIEYLHFHILGGELLKCLV